MRAKLLELGAKEFISTRGMQIAQLQMDGGVAVSDILDSITLSWPDDMKEEMKSTIRQFRESGESANPDAVVKKRGRPVGSKNKAKTDDEIPF
jgi:hypothetical protein